MEEREREEKARKREDWTGGGRGGEWIGGHWALVGAGEGFPEKPEECHYPASEGHAATGRARVKGEGSFHHTEQMRRGDRYGIGMRWGRRSE